MIGFVIIMQKKIIIDTDPGQDDAVAILLALASPNELNCLGITTVAGNVPLNLTSKNARIICELAGRSELKVFAGSESPMFRPLITAEHVHGKTGLDGPILPEPKMSLQDKNGIDFLIETLESHEPGSITLCCLGPLTNIAIALEKAPEIIKPDYSKSESWAVIPGKIPNLISDFYDKNNEMKDADVFFIYPTLIDGKDLKAWNSDIWDRHIRNDVLSRPVKYQASAWIESGNLYVPYYRQAHLRVFNKNDWFKSLTKNI